MRYQYTSKGYLNSLNQNQTISGVKLLIIINISIFLFMEFLLLSSIDLYERLFYNLSLIPNDVYPNLKIWQCITYLFLHGGIIHLLFNMLGLWFLGYELEKLWGKKNFLIYYFITGFGAAIITIIYNSILTSSYIPIVGASGSIYGSFFYSVTIQESNISHITHLSGMITGLGYLVYWKNQKQIKNKIQFNQNNKNEENELRKNQVDEILDKANSLGCEALTTEDQEFLQKESKYYYDTNKPN